MRRPFLVLPFTLFAAASNLLGAISGSVISVDGDPITRCAVTVHRLENSHERMVRLLSASPDRSSIASVVTDERGSFRAEVKDERVVDLVLRAEGYEPVTIRSEVDQAHLVVALRSAAPRTGVISAEGKPVGGALVVWIGSSSEVALRTDAAGTYSAPDPAVWAHRFLVLHPKYSMRDSMRERLFFQKEPPVDLTLSRGVTIAGNVTLPDGESPIAGAKLYLDGWPAGETADDGTFRIDRAPETWRWIEASAGDLAAARTRSGSAAYTLPLAASGTLRGAVVDAVTGRGLAQAEVRFASETESLSSAITGGNGEFSFPRLVSTRASVSAIHPGYLPATSQELDLRQSTRHVLKASPLARVTGVVVDDRKEPVAGARVGEVRRYGGANYSAGSRSGADGRFAIWIPTPGELELEALQRGFLPSREKLPVVEPGQRLRNVRLVLQKGIELSVRVTDDDGKAIPGAGINVAEEVEGSADRKYYACLDPEPCTTDANGLVTLTLRPGKHFFSLNRQGFASRELSGVAISRGQQPLEVVLARGVEITGVVTYDDGAPAVNVNVSASGANAKTAADGKFVIRGVQSGPTSVRVQHPIHGIDVPPKEVTAPASGVVFEIARAGAIRGRVIDRHTRRPITDFRVAVGHVKRENGLIRGIGSHGPSWIRVAAEDGTFAIADAPPGLVEVLVSAEGYLIGRNEDVRVESGSTTDEIEVALERGVRLVGRVVSQDGEPLAGVNLQVRPSSWRRLADQRGAATTTDDSGEFSLDALEPGEQTINLSKTGYVWTQHPISLAGEETRIELLLPRGYEIAVRVVDESGRPVAQASVLARTRDGRYVGMSGRTDASGRFTIQSVPEGSVDVTAEKQGLVAATVRGVDPKASRDIGITLRSGGVVTGGVIGLPEEELRFVRVHARVGDLGSGSGVDTAGRFRIVGVAEGLASVSAISGGRRSDEKTVDVKNGAEAQIELTFKSAFAVRGRVTSSGKPVIGAELRFFPTRAGQRPVIARTSPAGTYETRLEESGEYRIRVSRSSAGWIEETHVFAADATRDFELPEGSIRGRAVDAATGEPLSDVAITVQQMNPRTAPVPLRRTDGSGSFDAPAGPGRYSLVARKAGYGHQSVEVTVTEGTEASADFRLQRAEGLIVRPVDAETGAGVKSNVFVYDEQERLVFNDRQMEFSPAIRIPLAPGKYVALVQPSGDGHLTKRLRIVSPSNVTVRLDRAAALVLVLRTPGRHRVSVLPEEGKKQEMRIDAGTRRFGRMTPGTYVVELLSEEGATLATRRVTLAAGQETRIELP